MRPTTAAALLTATLAHGVACAQCRTWEPMGRVPGLGQQVVSATDWDPDGNGPRPSMLVMVGQLTTTPERPVSGVAGWDGTQWFDFAGGIPPMPQGWYGIEAVANHDGSLIVGGSTRPGFEAVVRWNGDSWASMGFPESRCYALAASDGVLAALGEGVYLWNGAWQRIGTYTYGARRLAWVNGHLYITGSVNGAPPAAWALSKWDGAVWSNVASPAYWIDYFADVVNYGGTLAAIGVDTNQNRYTVFRRLPQGNWEALPGVAPSRLIVSAGELYADRFRWNGSAWTPIANQLENLSTFVNFRGQLHAVGAFLSVDGRAAAGLARHNGTSWEAVAPGITGSITSIAQFCRETVIAGDLYHNEVPDACILRWTGAQWQPLLPFGIAPRGVAVYENDLIIGTTSPFTPGNYMHRWNGQSLSPLGGPYFYPVVLDGVLYGLTYWSIARYENGGWAPLGGTFNAAVHDLELSDGHLYAAGQFTAHDGAPITHVARWNGASWTALPGLPTATSPQEYAGATNLETFAGELFAAGSFGVYAWNGATWRQVQANPPTADLRASLLADSARLLWMWGDGNGSPLYSYDGVSVSVIATITPQGHMFARLGRTPDSILVASSMSSVGGVVVNNIARLPTACCGSPDFNGDGDAGTDADIEAFFACLAGFCCPTCDPRGADFNADGDTGTDQDIESFFRVLAGGPC
jgi:hypothetical protein